MAHHSMIQLDSSQCTDLSIGRHTEWMLANGIGGYAMTCVNQMLARRYHGLLVAAVEPPLKRFVLLAKLDATVTAGGLTYELATNDYSEAVHPQGFRLLDSFSPKPMPLWRWRLGDAVVEQSLWMPPGENAAFVRYRLVAGPDSVHIAVRPLCTSRHFHHLNHYQDIGPPTVHVDNERVSLAWPGGRPAWSISHNAEFKSRPDWYYQFLLSAEADRGYDHSQDLFMPGIVTAELRRGDETGLILLATLEDRAWTTWKSTLDDFLVSQSPKPPEAVVDPLAHALFRATGDFIVARGHPGKTIIAGYPWFGDWGRDTFISLPGLCLVTGRFVDARQIIDAFAAHVSEGMIPNRFPDDGESPEYNTVDASLWYIHAISRYLEYTHDWNSLAQRWFKVISTILDGYLHGTRHGIVLDADGLLAVGEPGVALTWMDAQVAGRAITPRIGKPVEVSALWYNALCIAADFAARLGDLTRADHWRGLAARCAAAFNARFWNPSRNCLYDVVDPDGRQGHADDSLRPNQLLAISLTHPVLDRCHWRAIVDVCQDQLLTPMGLRTLAPTDPAYRGRYAGDTALRDAAYHQGTVWPWLLGPFVTAYVRTHGESPQVRAAARKLLAGLEPHLSQAGLAGISEVADADAPHAPGGCPWQAWSVAEPLRALMEDAYNQRPNGHAAMTRFHRVETSSLA